MIQPSSGPIHLNRIARLRRHGLSDARRGVLFLRSCNCTGQRLQSALIDRPRTRCRQLDGMTGGVAEVNTLPAAIPSHSTFDRYAAFLKTELPYAQSLGGDCEGYVHGTLPIVRWDPTVRR